MTRLKHIVMMVASLVLLASCQKEAEPATRASSLDLYAGYALGVAETGGVTYRGIVGSRVTDGGEWIQTPWSPNCTSWGCTFVDGAGDMDLANNPLYEPATYDFYLLGSNGNDTHTDAQGRLVVDGGQESGNDYIWASLKGVNMTSGGTVHRSVTFSHLFSQVRFVLTIRGIDGVMEEMDDDGRIEIVDISGLGYRTDGVIDLENITSPIMQPDNRNHILQTARLNQRYLVVPHNGSSYTHHNCTIRIKADGKTFDVPLEGNLSLNAGKCRVIRLTYDGFSIQQIEIPEWYVGESFSIGTGASGGYEIPGWTH